MIAHLSTVWLILIFALSAIVIWFAGIKISRSTDLLSMHFNLGEALGGMIFLAIVTNLPEIAITAVASYNGHIEIASSNILGGIAMQTLVLVFVDIFGVGKSAPLTYKASSVALIIEGMILIIILTLVFMGKFVSPALLFFRTTPIELLIVGVWFFGIFLLSKKVDLPHLVALHTADSQQQEKKVQPALGIKSPSITPAVLLFAGCAIVTLVSGYLLEVTSEALADRLGISGAIFGATILAAATSLPEISTGIASARLKDYGMAMSDIFGGNAFLPILFLLASLINGKAILPHLLPSDLYLTGLGILLTAIYIIGLILRLNKQRFRMGLDSLAVLLVYLLGILGLCFS